jgi:hypothetical protein
MPEPAVLTPLQDRLCKDCAYHYEEWRSTFAGGREIAAHRCRILTRDPVGGGMGEPECNFSRSLDYLCSRQARFFEPRPGVKAT